MKRGPGTEPELHWPKNRRVARAWHKQLFVQKTPGGLVEEVEIAPGGGKATVFGHRLEMHVDPDTARTEILLFDSVGHHRIDQVPTDVLSIDGDHAALAVTQRIPALPNVFDWRQSTAQHMLRHQIALIASQAGLHHPVAPEERQIELYLPEGFSRPHIDELKRDFQELVAHEPTIRVYAPYPFPLRHGMRIFEWADEYKFVRLFSNEHEAHLRVGTVLQPRVPLVRHLLEWELLDL
jgi:hypothetical protein